MTITRRIAFRWLAAVTFVTTGAMHFTSADKFRRIVPPALPWPGVLVAVSGVAEVCGGLGLLVPRLRRPAGWGLVALLVAVFPANVHMLTGGPDASLGLPRWALWGRLPLQAVLIVWVAWVSRPAGTRTEVRPPMRHR